MDAAVSGKPGRGDSGQKDDYYSGRVCQRPAGGGFRGGDLPADDGVAGAFGGQARICRTADGAVVGGD